MSRGRAVSKAEVDRVLKALADAGQCASSIIIKPGEVIITPGLTGQKVGAQDDDLSSWRTKRAARASERP
jgi:hypothetical protein